MISNAYNLVRAGLLEKPLEFGFVMGAPNAQECEKWATNIVQLAQCAGYSVPGYVVMPPEAMPAPDFGEKEQEA